MSKVFVLDTNKRPLDPVHPGRARTLLKAGHAAVYRRYPFTIILKKEVHGKVKPLRLKIDPGSKTTGLAVVEESTGTVVWAGELTHRGEQVKEALLSRSQLRRGRRGRTTRYRKPRFDNRTRPEGWLPPSLMSRVHNIQTWVRRLAALSPVSALSLELARFDTQKLANPEISGAEYQQGTLFGYEVREYLLEKWGRRCAYCGKTDTPLELEHILPRIKGGTDRVSNLTLSCHSCNQAKGAQDVGAFLAHDPERLEQLLKQARTPLKDAAALNATRWKIYQILQSSNLPVEIGTGGRTKYNRIRQDYPKAHWIDAACVGESGEQVRLDPDASVLQIRAVGHGTRQMCGTDKYGFPKRHRTRQKRFFGFQTGDIVQAVVTAGKKAGQYTGRVAVRASGSFSIRTGQRDRRPAPPLHDSSTQEGWLRLWIKELRIAPPPPHA
jgi:5-methylcytosine-specific restriction endonuclease McrA